MHCQVQSRRILSLLLFCLSSSPFLAGLDNGKAAHSGFVSALALPRAQEIVPGTLLLPGSDILAPNRDLSPLEEVMLANPELITPARAAGTIFEGFEDPNREEQENLF